MSQVSWTMRTSHGMAVRHVVNCTSINQIPTDCVVSVVGYHIPQCSILSLALDPLLVKLMHSRLMIIDGPCSA